jgi:hypothetical protein
MVLTMHRANLHNYIASTKVSRLPLSSAAAAAARPAYACAPPHNHVKQLLLCGALW